MLRLIEFRLGGASELAGEGLMMFASHAFQSASNMFPLFAFEMGDGGLQVGPVSFIRSFCNGQCRLPSADGFGVRERGEI